MVRLYAVRRLDRSQAGPALCSSALAAMHLDVSPATLDELRIYGPIVVGAVTATLIGLLLGRPMNFLLGWSFRAFNRGFDLSTNAYTRAVGGLLRVSAQCSWCTAGLLALTWWGFMETPTGFIPAQDKGYLLVNVQLPDAASVSRTQEVVRRIEQIAMETPGINHTVAIAGQSILLNANASNFGALYLMLDPFRRTDEGGPFGRCDCRRITGTIAAGSAQGDREHLRRPAGGRPGHRGRFQDRDPGHQRLLRRRSKKTPRRSLPPGEHDAEPAGLFTQLPGRHALAGTGHRPHPGQGPRRLHRRHSHDPGVDARAATISTTSIVSAARGR